MYCCMGALNTAGFTSQLDSGVLPAPDHITYEGVFNEVTFAIGPKTELPLDLHIGFCRAQHPKSMVDSKPHDYLALFTKGGNDGQPRDDRVLNAVIILDISGSMSGGLNSKGGNRSRLDLSKEAIKMFFGKMRATDSFGLVIFDNKAYTVVASQRKDLIDEIALFALLEGITTRGGTTLKCGFDEGEHCLLQYLNSFAKTTACYNRLVMLTDVCDNAGINPAFIEKVGQSGIHTTVIGISDEFQSEACEKLIEFAGFNYFCAVEDDHLKKYLFECFDWTFFPANYDVKIELESDNIACFEVFGTPDSKRVREYNNFAAKNASNYTVTQYKSSFPSELEFVNGQVLTHGGLILVKIIPRKVEPSFSANIKLSYRTNRGELRNQNYTVKYELPGEQFYSEEALKQALDAYFFVSEMKFVLEKAANHESKDEKDDRKKMVEALQGLKQLAPPAKKDEVYKLIEIVNVKYDEQSQTRHRKKCSIF